ncbi:hypothetical protein [Polymorphobacter fuscus]|nr:hypothetical protein [Polymorphobacter fuscus]NJC08646.1 hypothetical protein [Polymorphobacter fuscus]
MQTFFATVAALVFSLASVSAAIVDLDRPAAAVTQVALLVMPDTTMQA